MINSCDIQIDFWNVGQGDASSIHLPNGNIILIDVGPQNSTLAQWLNEKTHHQEISHIFLTHNDSDHAGSLTSILNIPNIKIDNLYLLEDRKRTEFKKLFGYALKLYKENRLNLFRLECNSLQPKILWADNEYSIVLKYPCFSSNITSQTANHTSAIITLNFKDSELIIWGGGAPLGKIISLNNISPSMLFGPHHGSPIDKKSKNFRENVKKFAPQKTYISLGSQNAYSHPCMSYIKELVSSKTYVMCSQMTKQCNKGLVNNHLINTNGYYALPSPVKGNFCRGHLRFYIKGGQIFPDKYENKHKIAISKLRRALCQ